MLTIDIDIDVNYAPQQQFRITFVCRSDAILPTFVFEAPRIGNGIICDLTAVTDEHDHPLRYTLTEAHLVIDSQFARLRYTLHTDYQVCVGADIATNFVYPFISAYELFLSSGTLPYPVATFTGDTNIRLTLTGLPAHWQVFSSMRLPTPDRSTLHGFFLYASAEMKISSFHTDEEVFRFAAQRPDLDLAALWQYLSISLKWMRTTLAPYQPVDNTNILILQAPNNFEEIAHQKTFATGENFHGGIVTYGPNNPTYLRTLFGYADYDEFLKDGLIHELFHFYASGNALSGKKSLLYPSVTCDPYVATLLGERLIGYVHRQYKALVLDHDPDRFLQAIVVQPSAVGRMGRFAGLFVLDVYLRGHSSSLFAAFRQWLSQQARQPFTGLDEFLQIVASISAEPIPDAVRAMLAQQTPVDYQEQLDIAFKQIGYAVTVSEGMPVLVRLAEAALPFDLPSVP
jgi:hypothetical protein